MANNLRGENNRNDSVAAIMMTTTAEITDLTPEKTRVK